MASQLSPGVVLNEFDFSDYAERISTAIFGVVGTANKGPVNSITLITNTRQLLETFGDPLIIKDTGMVRQDKTDTTDQYRAEGLVLAAQQYLLEGNQCLCVRVATSSAAETTFNILQGGTTALVVKGITPGTWAGSGGSADNGLRIQIQDGTQTSAVSAYFKIIIEQYIDGQYRVREVYDNVYCKEVGGGDPAGVETSNYVETRINGISSLVKVTDQKKGRPTNVANKTWDVSGDDGRSGIASSDFYSSSTPKKGLALFEDVESVDVTILAAPGAEAELGGTDKSVTQNLVSVAETRGDAIALIDGRGSDTTPTLARDFINGTGSYSNKTDSSYAAYFWPWVQVYVPFHKRSVWVPPSAFAAMSMARTDRSRDPWWAPAGSDRGKIQQAQDVFYNTTLGERETLYAPGEVVNPIVNFAGEGVVIWGQKTTQRKSSSLNRINVRRMVNYAKKVIGAAVRVLVFNPNDEMTWRRFRNLVNPVLENIKNRRGLIDFKVICDSTTNTPDLIDQGVLRGILLLKPTKAAEVIQLDFTLLNTGAQFNEFVEGT